MFSKQSWSRIPVSYGATTLLPNASVPKNFCLFHKASSQENSLFKFKRKEKSAKIVCKITQCKHLKNCTFVKWKQNHKLKGEKKMTWTDNYWHEITKKIIINTNYMTNFTFSFTFTVKLWYPAKKQTNKKNINTEMKTSPKSKTSHSATVEELTSI